MAKFFLEAKDLDANVFDKTVLNRVNFSAERNKILSIIGPHGSGKSTLLRCLNGLFEEQPGHKLTGEIFFEGENILEKSYDRLCLRRSMSMVFARPTTFNHLSVFENVALGMRINHIESGAEIGDMVEKSLRRLNLWSSLKDQLHKTPERLSAGNRQLICLARSLALRPKAILMDEPTGVIGLKYAMQFEQYLREIADNVSIIMTTSSRKQAARISDRTAFLLDGELIEIGKTSDLFMNPKDTRTEDFLTGRFG